jgi:undecaprenyl-diphosphatase
VQADGGEQMQSTNNRACIRSSCPYTHSHLFIRCVKSLHSYECKSGKLRKEFVTRCGIPIAIAVHMPRPRRKARPLAPLLATAAVGAAGFAMTAILVAQHKTTSLDGRARRHFPKRRKPATRLLVHTLGYTGKPVVHNAAATLLDLYLSRHRAKDAGRAIALASMSSAAVSKIFDWVLGHRFAPPGRKSVTEPSFPSGHTLELAAVAMTATYVFWREGMLDGRLAIPIALAVPVTSGLGRLYLDRHWATDIIGGWCAGVSIAALCAAGYEARQ